MSFLNHGGQHHWEPGKFDPQIFGAPSVPDWIFSAPLTWRLPSSSWIKTSNASRNNLEKILEKGFQVVPGRGGRSFKRKMCSLHAKKKLAYRNVAARTETMPDGNNVFQTSPHGSCCCTQRFPRHLSDSKCMKHPVQCTLLRPTRYYYVQQCTSRYYFLPQGIAMCYTVLLRTAQHVDQRKQGNVTNRRDVPMPLRT